MVRFLLALILILNVTLTCLAKESTETLNDDSRYKINLQSAMKMALVGNIELQEQRKNLGISENDIKKANALKNPQLQSNILVGNIARGNSSQVGISLPIEVLKRSARKKSAQAGMTFTINKILDYEFKLKLRIRTAYFNLLLAKSNLKIMQERKELLEDLYEISKNKPQNTDNYKIELLQADMRLKKQLIQINKAKANVRTAQYNFNRVLNLENNLTLYDTIEDSFFDKSFVTNLELPTCEELEKIAFTNRYDIKMAESKILKAKNEINVATKNRVPDVQIAGGMAFTQDGATGSFIGAGIDMPVLYQYTPEIENAKLNYEKAQLEYNSIINITKNIIHTNHDKFIIAKENVEHYRKIIEESTEILKLSKQRYSKGKSQLTNLIIIEHSHQELLNEYVNAMGVYYNAYISLLQEVGVDSFKMIKEKSESL